MSFESINRLSELTGRDRRTVKKALVSLTPRIEGKAHLYDSQEALLLIYGSATSGDFDLTEERARLSHHQANIEGMKEDQLSGTLLDAEEVEAEWADLVMSFRARMLALPTRLASMAIAASTLREVEDFARDEIYAALEELSESVEPG